MPKKKVLFVGVGGAVAEKILPPLAQDYDIVGIAGRRQNLKNHCVDFYTGDLFVEYASLFEQAFSRHNFDSIIWNPVHYYPGPLLESSRQSLHAEFDLAIALPLECLKAALAHSFGQKQDSTFVVITSGLAFGTKQRWGSYSIVKRGQVILTDYLATELAAHHVHPKAIALGSVPALEVQTMYETFVRAIENTDYTQTLYLEYEKPNASLK